jgi:hypothetical protein
VGFKEREWKCVDWINLADNRDKWQVVLKMVMEVWVP